MKLITYFFTCCIFLLSCNQSQNKPQAEEKPQVKPVDFFPVTDFIRGQIAEIKSKGINPIKTTTVGGKSDSAWLKVEKLDEEFAPFLSPLIDSSNLASMFTESSFQDQTLDAFTFTYDPVKPLPDSFLLQHWDVYVDAKSNTVRRIYLLKKTPDHKILQLTWLANTSCKIVTISNDHVEKEVSIKWDF